MIRQLLITVALASVAATAMAGLARIPASHFAGAHALSTINPMVLLQRLADDDEKKPDSTTDQSHSGVPTGIRADIGRQPTSGNRSPTLLNTLAQGTPPRRWSF